jgi:protein-tyrosine phosphatase
MLAEQLAKEGVALELLVNGEHHLTAELLTRISAAEVVTIGGRSRWLLTELPWGGLADVEGVLFRLQTRGFRILLAHPERHSCLDLATLARLVERGICMQVELGSYIGLYGHDEEVRAWDMLNKGLTHVIATDLHRAAGAQDWLPEALQAMAKSRGREAVEMGTRHNPQLIIRDASADDLIPLG